MSAGTEPGTKKPGLFASCCGGAKEQEANRTVRINQGNPHEGYRNNETHTTKYNLLTFLPKALFEQYR